MDWKKLLGENAKDMLKQVGLDMVKEMGSAMAERDRLARELEQCMLRNIEYKRRLESVRAYAVSIREETIQSPEIGLFATHIIERCGKADVS